MDILNIIEKKKHKQALTKAEIDFFVNGFTDGSVADYQMSSLLMAILLNGMDDRETFDLTMAMLNSGDVVDTSSIDGLVVDKHSTGGVGDSTTLALAPVLACCGVYVAKMSGRGLGFTGGTVDKLESIPNFNTAVAIDDFIEVVKKVGCAVIGQTANLVPADKKMYALRDVTATVDAMPLICSSIMSKKLASGADVILLDVKYGNGAFMKTKEEALLLAQKMVDIGMRANKKIGALITDMEQPLSNHIGNTLEILGIIDVLKGAKNRLYDELLEVATRLLVLGGGHTLSTAREAVLGVLESGEGLEKFAEMVFAQQGDGNYIKNPQLFSLGKVEEIKAESSGFVTKMQTADIGRAVVELGGGRHKKDDEIDHSVGVVMKVNLGDFVEVGAVLCEVYHNNNFGLETATAILGESILIGKEKPIEHKIAYAYVDKNGVEYY